MSIKPSERQFSSPPLLPTASPNQKKVSLSFNLKYCYKCSLNTMRLFTIGNKNGSSNEDQIRSCLSFFFHAPLSPICTFTAYSTRNLPAAHCSSSAPFSQSRSPSHRHDNETHLLAAPPQSNFSGGHVCRPVAWGLR